MGKSEFLARFSPVAVAAAHGGKMGKLLLKAQRRIGSVYLHPRSSNLPQMHACSSSSSAFPFFLFRKLTAFFLAGPARWFGNEGLSFRIEEFYFIPLRLARRRTMRARVYRIFLSESPSLSLSFLSSFFINFLHEKLINFSNTLFSISFVTFFSSFLV